MEIDGKKVARKTEACPCRAFTLIELVVVMGIIVLILSLALPAFNKLTQGNSIKQATNMVTAYITSARAAALQQKRSVALIFFEETAANSPGGNSGQTAVMLAREITVDTTNSNVSYFGPLPGRSPEYLPSGIKVATLNGAGTLQSESTAGSTAACRAIVFDPSGQMVLRNGLGTYSSNQTTPATPPYMPATGGVYSATISAAGNGDWQFTAYPASSTAITADASSTPGVLVYDGNEYQSAVSTAAAWSNATSYTVGMLAIDTGNLYVCTTANSNKQPSINPSSWAAWAQQHGDILVVNIYTGNVIR